MKRNFYDKLKNDTRIFAIDRITKAEFIFTLREDYRDYSSYTDIYIEYKNGIRKEGNGSIHNSNFDPDENKTDIYIVAEEY